MSVNRKSRSVLGDNPLSQSIFSKTEPVTTSNPTGAGDDKTLEPRDKSLEFINNSLESGNESLESKDKNLESGNESLESRENNLESENESLEFGDDSLESREKKQDSSLKKRDSSKKKTDSRIKEPDSRDKETGTRIKKTDSRVKSLETVEEDREAENENLESRFLRKDRKEALNLRVPIELNDWMDDLVKKGKRRHGSKIPKEVWLQAALELFRAMPVDWEDVVDEDDLREVLDNLESGIKDIDL
jgi:hypothetical protein